MTCLLHVVIFTTIICSCSVLGKCINIDKATMDHGGVGCKENVTDDVNSDAGHIGDGGNGVGHSNSSGKDVAHTGNYVGHIGDIGSVVDDADVNGGETENSEELNENINVRDRINNSMEYSSASNKTREILNGTYHSSNHSTLLETSTYTTSETDIPYEPNKKQHLTIIIVGPTAAVSIALFLCIAYYFHNAQLNKKAKRLSFTIYVSPEPSTDSVVSDTPRVTRVPVSIPNSPRTSLRVSREASPSPRFSREASPNAWLAVDNADVFGQRRKSTLTTNTLSVPGNIQGKRGSHNWNAFADHEILTLSAPRRHSTFII